MYNQIQEPVAKAVMKLHNNNANIADAFKIYLEILQNKELNPHFSKVKSSFYKTMRTVYFLARKDEKKDKKIRRNLLVNICRF